MQAVSFARQGGPEVLELASHHLDPVPGPGEVLIRVEAAGVNYADLMTRAGLYPVPVDLPMIPGLDVAGTVQAVSPDVTRLAVGDRVAALLPRGGYAQLVAAPAGSAARIPDNVRADQSTAMILQGLTAHFALERAAQPEGKAVLVTAAAGGVGSLAVQLARLGGARRVVGLAGGSKLDAVRALGADEAIDYTSADWFDRTRAAFGQAGCDVVLDLVGGAVARTAFDLLAPFGRLVIVGAPSGELFALDADRALRAVFGNLAVVGFALPNVLAEAPDVASRAAEVLLGHLAAGRLQVRTESFPLPQAADAHRAIAERRTTGKVVLIPQQS